MKTPLEIELKEEHSSHSLIKKTSPSISIMGLQTMPRISNAETISFMLLVCLAASTGLIHDGELLLSSISLTKIGLFLAQPNGFIGPGIVSNI